MKKKFPIKSGSWIAGLYFSGVMLILCLEVNAQDQPPDLDWEALISGEIHVEKVRDDQGQPGIRAIFTISGTRNELWGMLTDYENFSKIYNGIDSVYLITEDHTGAKVRICQDIKIRKIKFVLHRRYEKPGYRLSWNRISGDLKMVKGAWDILDTPENDKKLVVYTSYFKYGGIVPSRLTRNWAMNEVRDMGFNARRWLLENRELYNH